MRAHGLAEELSGVFAGARGLLSNLLDLFTLEARHAGLTLAAMLACAAVGAILVATAWLGAVAAVALWAIRLGMSWEAAFGLLAGANLVLAGALFWWCARVSRDLLFSATRRQLHATRLALV